MEKVSGRPFGQPALVASRPEPQSVSAHAGDGQAHGFAPCPTPWCENGVPYVWQHQTDKYGVICGFCQVEGPYRDSEDEAVDAWNDRPLCSTDGYVAAFYEIGRMLGFHASPEGPAYVWEHRMRPKLQALLGAQKVNRLGDFLARGDAEDERAAICAWLRADPRWMRTTWADRIERGDHHKKRENAE